MINWWHKINLPEGVTPGRKDCPEDIRQFKFPPDLFVNKTVLDIGAWDGFFSFYAEQHGAKEVLAVDPYMWGGNDWGSKEGFNYACKALNSKVKSVDLKSIYEIDTLGTWDIVLFLGVFYHLKDPLLITELACNAGREIVVETLVSKEISNDKPMMVYYPQGFPVPIKNKTHMDKTTYWAPNINLVDSIVKKCGFKTNTFPIYKGDRCICYGVK